MRLPVYGVRVMEKKLVYRNGYSFIPIGHMLMLLLMNLVGALVAYESWRENCGLLPPRPFDTRFPPEPPLMPVLRSSWPREIESTPRSVIVTLLGQYFDDWIDLLVCKMGDGHRVAAVVINESAVECKLPFTGSFAARAIWLRLETLSQPVYQTDQIAILIRPAADYRAVSPHHASTRGSARVWITGVNFPVHVEKIESPPVCIFGNRGDSGVHFVSDTKAWCAVPPANSSGRFNRHILW
ncbi:hypothetical protein FOZ62_024177 [Perkinsus olseni]|uniref:Uncharacterized protein n=1 Tax=Perkinsus olseni TaxID=32597 RepID=A0A7J6QC80_PEROL|nr:hypothetical protein FOZ62_024177 [Perkinsus olseni]